MRGKMLFAIVVVAVLALAITPATFAQSKSVTFMINTATMPDTVTGFTDVTVTGSHAAITGWGAGAKATRIGGDYWKATVSMTQGDTVNYKFRIAGGWENDLDGVGYAPNGNRHLVVGASDTTLPVEFYNASGSTKAQYWKPWGTAPANSKTIYFRTNTAGLVSQVLNPAVDTMGVRGDKAGGTWNDPNFGWSPTRYLKREGTAGMAGFIWSGPIHLSASNVVVGDMGNYKFIIGPDWGRQDGDPNREFKIPVGPDTTLYWEWYNREAPVVRANNDTVTVTFVANMTTATQKQSFQLGDTVQVQVGFYSTADSTRTINLVKQGGTQNYAASVKMVTKVGAFLDYQYYLVKNGSSIREYYFNFDYNGTITAEQERRQVMVTAGGTMTVTDNVVSVTSARRQPYFENQRKLSKDVTVNWEVDLRPAFYTVKYGKTLQDIQGELHVTHVDSIVKWGAAMNGPGSAPAVGGWAGWGRALWADTTHRLYDDGTNGDRVAGDSIYTRQLTYTTANTVGQVFKFGIGGGDNESGFGLNHLENIDDANATVTMSMQFGSINPKFYDRWDFTNRVPIPPPPPSKVNVTFMINTATVPDTVTGFTDVTVTGSHAAITGWGAGAKATRVGGDYWKATVEMAPGDTVNYKFRVSGGWENDLDGITYAPNGNRHLIVGTSDMVLPVEFYNASGSTKAQYWKPWGTAPANSKTIYFRTNTAGLVSQVLNPAVDTMGVRGDKAGGTWNDPNFGWSPTRYLKREGTAGMAGFIWSGPIHLSASNVVVGDMGNYKFIIGPDWGRQDSDPNREFKIPVGPDTTLYWEWYNRESPVSRNNTDTVTVTFVANMTTATQKQSFQLGDTVQVQVGYYSTADSTRTINLVKQGGTQNYAASVKMVTKIGSFLDYQYYLVKNGNSIREYYFNFDYNGTITAEQERRQVTVAAGGTMTVTDNVVSVTSARRQPYFENQRKLSKDVTVNWEVDLRPAFYTVKNGKTLQDIQGELHVTHVDSIVKWGAAMNGPGSAPAVGGWAGWGRALWADTTHRLYDDGTNGDRVAGDSIYTRRLTYTTANSVGQVFKFGIGGGDNESGFGLNHLENIDDANATVTMSMQFGSINPKFYDGWDFTNRVPLTGVGSDPTFVPDRFALAQNYPNPFNPTTKISFDLPVQSNVTVTVFNVLGQEVGRVVDGVMNAGRHEVSFDAKGLSSGIYFYQLHAGEFTSMKKMILMK